METRTKIPTEGSQFAFRTGKSYYPQVFLEECKYAVKEKKILSLLLMILKFLIERILMKKFLIKKTLMEKILMKKIQMKKNLMKKILMKKILMKKIKIDIYIYINKTNRIFFYNFFVYVKTISKYYQKYKKKLRKEARERYQNLSEEEKEKRCKKA